MNLEGAVAVVTGANGGMGRAFARALLEHGAAKVYAGARNPESVTDPDLVPIQLDVTDPEHVAAAAALAADATIVINNAGAFSGTGLLDGSFDAAREAIEVNCFGTWSVSRGFASVLARNGGGALVSMLSRASWLGRAENPGYSASKAAQWSLTEALREGLHEQGTLVVGVHASFINPDPAAESDPTGRVLASSVAEQTMQALANNWIEVIADEPTRIVKASLSRIRRGE